MKYVKLVARPHTWFKEGTEVYDYDFSYSEKKRITLDYWNKQLNDKSLVNGICVRGITAEDEREDGEFCSFDEFDVEIVEE